MATEQTEIPGTERRRIRSIENAASKADAKRSIINGLEDELKNLVAKISEQMHLKEAELDVEENDKGEKMLIYRRGDFNVVVKYKESVNYKIKSDSKGEPPKVEEEELSSSGRSKIPSNEISTTSHDTNAL